MEQQKEGIKIWETFYVKPIMMNFADEDPNYIGKERYLIVNYILIQDDAEISKIYNAYAYWKVSKLEKVYNTDHRNTIKNMHFKNIAKDDYFFIEGVLTTTGPEELQKAKADEIIQHIRGLKEKEKTESTDISIPDLFTIDIMINDIHKKAKGARVITQRTLNILEELRNTLPIAEDQEEGTDEIADGLLEKESDPKEQPVNQTEPEELKEVIELKTREVPGAKKPLLEEEVKEEEKAEEDDSLEV